MLASLKSRCPHCEAVIKVKDSHVGKRVRCPACKQPFSVDSVEAASNSPSLDKAPSATETVTPASSDTSNPAGASSARQSAAPFGAGLSTPTILGRLGRFELKELLGQGAFGRVYKAYDPQLDRFVALKVPTFAPDDKHKTDRFLTEARSAARLRHPNIVPVYDAGNENGQLFIASAFIEGQTLAARLEQGRPDFRESAQWVMALANALDTAHSHGIVHRDVKPANIMLDSKGAPLLMDFGLARIRESEHKLTFDGSVLGTPAYMSPEQAAGKLDQVGPASDQYSLGAVLYELLCGKRPFDGPAALVISQVLGECPAPPATIDCAIPRELEAACLKAMSKNSGERHATCQRFAEELDHWSANESVRSGQLVFDFKLARNKSQPRLKSKFSLMPNFKWTFLQRFIICCTFREL